MRRAFQLNYTYIHLYYCPALCYCAYAFSVASQIYPSKSSHAYTPWLWPNYHYHQLQFIHPFTTPHPRLDLYPFILDSY